MYRACLCGPVVLKARITFRHDDCYSQGLTGRSTAAQITRDAERDVYIMHGTSQQEVDTYVKAMKPVFGTSLEIMDRTPRSVLYRGSNPPHATVAAVLKSGCSVLWPVVFGNDRQLLTIVAADRAHLDELVHDLGRLGTPTIDQVTNLPPEALTTHVSLADFVGTLTERQVSIIWYAIESGYYETPRRISINEIAAHFGIARSTLNEHLRKAERGILNQVTTIFASIHTMLPHATRKMGRPRTYTKRQDESVQGQKWDDK